MSTHIDDMVPEATAGDAGADMRADMNARAQRLGHPVDLVMANAVEDPFVRAGVERSRQAPYGA